MLFRDVARAEVDGRIVGLDVSGDISYVSHAHSDHVNGKNKKDVIASQATIDIAEISYNKKLKLKDVKLHNAGHMLGATQIEIMQDGGNFVYTGDISLKDGFTFDGADPIEADRLLIESTYGSPDYQFPKKEELASIIKKEVLSRLNHGNIIFALYPRGKSQELIKILNEQCGITPVVFDQIARISSKYAKHGRALNYVSSASEEAPRLFKKNFVGIIPKSGFRLELKSRLTHHYKKPAYFVSLSGWNIKFANPYYDLALPFSDHADFNDLLEYVEYSNPKEVYVFGPFAENFSNVLKLKGYQSYAVK